MTERERIDSRLRDLIISVLRDERGDDAVIYRTYDGKVVKDQSDWSVVSWPEPADPAQAIELARLIEGTARGLWRRYAEQARGAGKTWLELADAVGVDADEDERDHLAFRLITGEPTSSWREPYASWRCGSCGERIRDVGPYGGHPDDSESGHAEDCMRHKAEVAQYVAHWDDDVDDEDEGDEG